MRWGCCCLIRPGLLYVANQLRAGFSVLMAGGMSANELVGFSSTCGGVKGAWVLGCVSFGGIDIWSGNRKLVGEGIIGGGVIKVAIRINLR